jgi:vitamin B12 transporter
MFGISRFLPARPAVARPAAAIFAAACCSLALSASSATATDERDDDTAVREEIMVTATRSETPLSQVGSSVTVLEGHDLELRGFSSVSDALRSAPGLDLSRSGGPGQTTSVFVRGGSSSQTLVLLDGVRLNSATTGAYDFADLSLDEVERIEIVRGPQSPLYGSEAAAGVIQIITRKDGSGFSGSALGEIGEDEHNRLRLSASGGDGDGLSGRISLATGSIEAVSAADPRRGNSELDRHENRTASGSLGWAASDSHRLDLDLRYFEGESEIDGFAFPAGPVDDLDARLSRTSKVAGLSYFGQPRPELEIEARLGFADDDLEAEDPTDPFGSYVIDSEDRELGLRVGYTAGSHRLSAGASREEREGGTALTFGAEIEIDGIYLQDQVALGEKASLTLGVRRDDHSAFGSEETGRAALAVQAWQGGRIHASWGQGFKAPTLNDLYYPFFSNPDLKPERSEAFDLGVEHSFGEGEWIAGVTYFDAEFEDLIAFDFVTFLPQNIAAATSRGVEAELRWRGDGDRVQAGGTYTWNETEDESTGLQLARRPEGRATLDVSFRPADNWRVAAHAVAVRDRIDSDGTLLEDYDRFDLSASFRFGRFEPGLRVLNVTDDETSEIGGYGAQGRTAILSLDVSF